MTLATPRIRRLGRDVVPLAILADAIALVGAVLVTGISMFSTVLLSILVVTFNAVGGHYRARIAPALLDELPGLIARALVAGAITSAVRLYLDMHVQDGPVLAAVAFAGLASAGRLVAYPLVRRSRRVGQAARPTVIIGCGPIGNQLAAALRDHPEYGLSPVGFVDDAPSLMPEDRRLPFLGGIGDLARLMAEHDIRTVIVAFTSIPEPALVDAVRSCDRMSAEIFCVPRLHELHGSGASTEVIWGLPLMRMNRAWHRCLTWRFKRIFDVMVASIFLVLLAPVLAAIAIAVRVETGPGVIFRQERVGLDGRLFTILKFRSLKPATEVESSALWNIGDDPRVGPVGRLLRRLSLDEMPQLWNVIRGDMSIVGPRPERPLFVDEFTTRIPRYVARHRVPVGMTGWAQINGLRGDTDIADRANFDNYYIENWSMWNDVKIILRTAGQLVGARGR